MPQERKVMTVLFADIVDSSATTRSYDAEVLRAALARMFARTREILVAHGGTVEKFIGDAVMAVFGVPVAHEDDAERAVQCALSIRIAVAGLNDTLRPRFGLELAVRIGVDTGEAVVTGRIADAIATGDVLNTAARLEAAAGPGEILVGRDTMLLSRNAVAFEGPRAVEAKGKSAPVEAWVPTALGSERPRAKSPLVGRVAELEVLS